MTKINCPQGNLPTGFAVYSKLIDEYILVHENLSPCKAWITDKIKHNPTLVRAHYEIHKVKTVFDERVL